MFKKLMVFGTALCTLLALKVSCNAYLPCGPYELLQTTDFKSGISLPWQLSESDDLNAIAFIKDEKFVVQIDNKGIEKWDVQIRHRDFSILADRKYLQVSFQEDLIQGVRTSIEMVQLIWQMLF